MDEEQANALLAAIQQSEEVSYKNVELVHRGSRFILAQSRHVGTDRQVLMTIAPPGDAAGAAQLTVMRKLFDWVSDARIGSTHDRIWDRRQAREASDASWACLVSTFHTDAVPVDKSLVALSDTLPTVDPWTLIVSLAEQVRSIHAVRCAHGDLSTSNIVVDKFGKPHIVDFEHCVAGEIRAVTRVAYTEGFSHPNKKHLGPTSPMEITDHQVWDLYAVGKIYLDILSLITPSRFPSMTVMRQRAVRMIACMLLDGQNTNAETAMGLHVDFFSENKIKSASDLCSILDRLSGRPGVNNNVPELRSGVDRVIEVGSVRPSSNTTRVHDVLGQMEFRYLDTFNQLGMINFIWPKATHRRYVHALGTFATCCEAVDRMLSDTQNPIFSILMNSENIRILLCAALLHDIGHYPLAHDIEEAIPGFLDHEDRSVRILNSQDWVELLARPELQGGWEINSRDVASVIQGMPVEGASITTALCHLLHTVISGSLDVDKLDYLVRDSLMLDVKAGEGVDRARIFAGLTVAVVSTRGESPKLTIAVAEKMRRPAELVGRVRSHLFGVAYWHHTYRSIKCMIQWIVWSCALSSSSKTRTAPSSINSGAGLSENINLVLASSISDRSLKSLCSEFLVHVTNDMNSLGNELKLLELAGQGTLNIPVREFNMLAWWASRDQKASEPFMSSLKLGEPFETVLELSHPARLSVSAIGQDTSPNDYLESTKAVWSMLNSVRSTFKELGLYIKFRYVLALQFQLNVQNWLIERRQGNATTIVYNFLDSRDQFISAAAGQQLFLIDFPDESKSYQKPLYVAASEGRYRTTTDSVAGIEVTQSYDSVRVGEEFVISNGYVRIFCSQRHSQFVQQAISIETICRLLQDAINDAVQTVKNGSRV